MLASVKLLDLWLSCFWMLLSCRVINLKLFLFYYYYFHILVLPILLFAVCADANIAWPLKWHMSLIYMVLFLELPLVRNISELPQDNFGRGGLSHITLAGSILHGMKEVLYFKVWVIILSLSLSTSLSQLSMIFMVPFVLDWKPMHA